MKSCFKKQEELICPNCKNKSFSLYEVPRAQQGVIPFKQLCPTCDKLVREKVMPALNKLYGKRIFSSYKSEDNKVRTYKHKDYKTPVDLIVCMQGTNKLFRAKLRVALREGESAFGEEMVFQLDLIEEVKEYPATSKREHIEFYIPKQHINHLIKEIGDI